MPSVNDLRESKYLTQSDVEPAVDVTISGYSQVNMAKDGAPAEMKWVLSFAELPKPLTLNSTNGGLIEAITGSGDFDGWTGKRIQLYRDPLISFGGKVTGGIRVRQAGSTTMGAVPPAQDVPKQTPQGDPDIPF
jgi:hypothetical protein